MKIEDRIEPTIDFDKLKELELLEVTGKDPVLYEKKKSKLVEVLRELFKKFGQSRVYRERPVPGRKHS